jgi:hypothetical protein
MNKIHAAVQDSEGLLDLLEIIVASYHDADSRPEESLVLYRQCLQLSKNYQVHLAKRFLVVEGGARNKPGDGQPRATQARGESRLKLAAKLELREDL